MARKVRTSDLMAAIQKYGVDVNELAKVTGLSRSNIYYRLRSLRKQKILNRYNKIIVQKSTEQPQYERSHNDLQENVSNNYICTFVPLQLNTSDFVPKNIGEYIYRDLDKLVYNLVMRDNNVLMLGEAGTGKTRLAEQLAHDLQVPFLRVACDDSAILREFIGRREINNGTTFYKEGLLTAMVKVPSVILIDEFNALPPSKLFFLHELLDNKRIFIKECDRIVHVSPDCKILLACNPIGAKYAGTNRLNVALVDRCSVVPVQELSINDMKSMFNTRSEELTKLLIKFYKECRETIKNQRLRVTFSIRSLQRIVMAIQHEETIENALAYGFYNMCLATATENERNALEKIASVILGDIKNKTVKDFIEKPKETNESNEIEENGYSEDGYSNEVIF